MTPRALFHSCCCPVFAEVMRSRVVALVVAATGAAQLVASTFHFGYPCPFRLTTGLPCPGCGLTRSVLALLHGNVGDSLRWHPFGPLLFAGLIVSLIAAVAPEAVRRRMVSAVGFVEQKSALAAVAMVLLMILWVIRLSGLLPLYAT